MEYSNTLKEQVLQCKNKKGKIECLAQRYIECLENVANKTGKNDFCNTFIEESIKIISEEMTIYKNMVSKPKMK